MWTNKQRQKVMTTLTTTTRLVDVSCDVSSCFKLQCFLLLDDDIKSHKGSVVLPGKTSQKNCWEKICSRKVLSYYRTIVLTFRI